jgi:hypothetical protein
MFIQILQFKDGETEPVGPGPPEAIGEDDLSQSIVSYATDTAPDEGIKNEIAEKRMDNDCLGKGKDIIVDSSRSEISTITSATLNPGEPCNDSTHRRKPARGTEPFEKWEREQMEQLLGQLRGHLGAQI